MDGNEEDKDKKTHTKWRRKAYSSTLVVDTEAT